MVLADIPAESAWGRHYRALGAQGHPFYSADRFLTRDETLEALERAGLRLVRARSTLRQPPPSEPRPERAVEGEDPEAGFVAWLAVPI